MSLKDRIKKCAYLLPLALGALSASVAAAGDYGCGGGSCGAPACAGHSSWPVGCPAPFVHYAPKVPCIKFKCACGKPVCDICDMQSYGYYPTCWRAWDQPLNYQCAVPTPTQLVAPPALVAPQDEIPVAPVPRQDDGFPRR